MNERFLLCQCNKCTIGVTRAKPFISPIEPVPCDTLVVFPMPTTVERSTKQYSECKYLTEVFKELGISGFKHTFAALCRTPMNSKGETITPPTKMLTACSGGLFWEIEAKWKPKRIIAMGAEVAKLFAPPRTKVIPGARFKWRGIDVLASRNSRTLPKSAHHAFTNHLADFFNLEVTAATTHSFEREVVTSPQRLIEIFNEHPEVPYFSFDIENKIDNTPEDCAIRIIGVSFDGDKGYLCYHTAFTPESIAVIEEYNKRIPAAGSNIFNHDRVILIANMGLRLDNIIDTLVTEAAWDEYAKDKGLKQLAAKYEGAEDWSPKDKSILDVWSMPEDKLESYLLGDACYQWRVAGHSLNRLVQHNQDALYFGFLHNTGILLSDLKLRGVRYDCENAKALEADFDVELNELEGLIHDKLGKGVLISSPAQVLDALNRVGVPVGATNEKELNMIISLGRDYEGVCEDILEWRKFAKLKSTYTQAMLKLVDRFGRIHTTFNLDGSRTYRLSSKNPNLQNIPAPNDNKPLNKKIRSLFLPDEGCFWGAVDFSQIELRIAAIMSKDKELLEAFSRGEDVHTFAASKLYGCAISEVTRSQRTTAKTLNFGVLYGSTVWGLMRNLKLTFAEASEILDFWKNDLLRDFYIWQAKLVEQVANDGYFTSLFGRRHRFLLREAVLSDREIRQIGNTIVQCSASDLNLVQAWKVEQEVGPKINLLVHDEIDSASITSATELQQILEVMNDIGFETEIPLLAEANLGANWGECK